MSFTLAGKMISHVHAEIPSHGVASADVRLDGASVLSGAATLTLGDLSMEGTIVHGEVSAGRGFYHWNAGAAGWRTSIAARGYPSSGVRRSAVIRDAAEACGEQVNQPPPDLALGLPGNGGYLRPAGPAWDVLRAFGVPWYVDTAGVTQIAERPSGAASTDGTLEGAWPDERRLVVVPAAERLAGYMPGLTLGGALIATTRIDVTPGEPIRLTLLTRDARGESSDLREQLDIMHAQNAAKTRFHGKYRYRAVSRNGTLYGLDPVNPALGLPRLDNRDLWFGVPGFDATLFNATPSRETSITVIVSFLDGDPAQAVIDGYQREGSSPAEMYRVALDGTRVDLGGASQLVGRETDPVSSGALDVSAAVPTALVFSYVNQDGAVKTWTIAGAVVGANVAFAVVGAPNPLVTSAPVTGRIMTPGQTKVRA